MRLITSALSLLLLSAAMPGCKKTTTQTAITYSGEPRVGYPVTFHSTDPGNCLWDFGDSSRSTDAAPSHAFYSAGSFTVSLTLNNDASKKATTVITIAPSYSFSFSGTPAAGHTVTFASNAAAGNTFAWSFGDGAMSTDATPAHVFSSNGSYTVSLVLNHDSSHVLTKTVTIFANAVFVSNLAGTRLWHHTYTDAVPWPPYHTTYPYADTTITVTIVDPATIAFGADTLTYYTSIASDSVLTFYKNNISFYYNHFTQRTDYFRDIHISAGAGNATVHYYCP